LRDIPEVSLSRRPEATWGWATAQLPILLEIQSMRRFLAILALAALATGCAEGPRPWAAAGEGARQPAAAGQVFVRRACAGCHAVGPLGDSPNPHSPPFRTLAALLPGPALEAQLSAITQHGHVEMPPIYMTPDEIGAVAAYIRSVREPEPGPRGDT
jgi:mono/diheme cytochrome c family protein